MTTQTELDKPSAPAAVVADVSVRNVERLSPAFVRVTFTGPALVDLGEEGFDTRFKMIFPNAAGALPPIPDNADDWYQVWVNTPDGQRAPMRTYTIRDILHDAGETLLVIDFVVHEDHGAGTGPACRWALAAGPGDVVQVMVPHRLGVYGGTEFDPGELRHLLLIGDETTAPAIARILSDVGPDFTGEVFLEVPTSADILDFEVPAGFTMNWLARGGAGYGQRLVQEVRRHLGLPAAAGFEPEPELPSSLDVDVWETPRFSSSGEDVEPQLHTRSLGHDLADTYAWIAGESGAVKVLRRSLVGELDVERRQVAFMGYWREGVSMKS